MSRIIPLSCLKNHTSAIIKNFEATDDAGVIKRLHALGFIPGRRVEINNRNAGSIIVKIGDDNALAIDKKTADIVLVRTLQDDIFEKADKPQKSVLSKILKVFKS